MFEKPPQPHRQDGRPMKPLSFTVLQNIKPPLWLFRGLCAAVYGFWISLMILFFMDQVRAEDQPTQNNSIVHSLLIEWTAPTSLEDGTPLPLEHVTGYDVFQSLDGVDVGYLQWVPAQSRPRLSWRHDTHQTGTHCYQLRTVTEIYGKSQLSAPVCVTVQANPMPPENLSVTKKGAAL